MHTKKEKLFKVDYIYGYILPFLVALGDYIAIILSEKIILGMHFIFFKDDFYIPIIYFYLWIPTIFIFFLFYTGGHKRMIPFWEVMKNIFYADFYSVIISIFILYLIHQESNISQFYMILFLIIPFITIYLMRQLLVFICNKLDILREPVIFVGAGKTTETIIRFFNSNNCFGIKVVGIIDETCRSKYLKENYRFLQGLSNIKKYIEVTNTKTIIIAAPKMDKYKLIDLIDEIQLIVKNIEFVPNIIGASVTNLEMKRLYAKNLILLNVKNNLASLRSKISKRIFDLILSLLICIPVVPIIILLSIWVKLDSKGPVFFNAKRIGKDGKTFTCYKFRSMHLDSDKILEKYLNENQEAKKEWDEFQKLKDFDPRVTKAGRIMRKTSLDELPQILNVLKGEMSLVGPRPYLPREIDKMGKYYPLIISTVPGITGFWQVNGRSDVTFEGRLKMDNWYIRNWSVWIDMVLLIQTVKAVFFSKGAV